MSYDYDEYEFVCQDSAGSRGGEVIEFLLQVGTSRREIDHGHVDLYLFSVYFGQVVLKC